MDMTKVLKAKYHPKIEGVDVEVELVSVKDLMIIPSKRWLDKKGLDILMSSMDKAGMLYPIIYTDLKHYWQKEKNWPKDDNGTYKEGIAVHTGNKRVWYAKEKGYDLIEGYFAKDKPTKDKINSRCFMVKDRWPKEELK